jgi:hypothetical protein
MYFFTVFTFTKPLRLFIFFERDDLFFLRIIFKPNSMYRVLSHMKMQNKLIRIFVNEKNVVEIHKYASVYSLKSKIVDKIYNNVDINKINLYHNGKQITVNDRCLDTFGIKDNSNVTANISINGGGSDPADALKWIYIVALIFYILFLFSGLLPVIATGFANMFRKTIKALLGKHSEKGIGRILFFIFIKIPSFLLSWFSIPLFVWATSSYMMFPWLYSVKNDYCNSGLASKDIGFWSMAIFTFVYVLFNLVDFFFNIFQSVIHSSIGNNLPIITGPLGAQTEVSKTLWDITKFTPVYLLSAGTALFYHEAIDVVLGLVYTAMDTIKNFNCEEGCVAEELCSLFSKLNKEIRKKGKKDKNGVHPMLSDLKDCSGVNEAELMKQVIRSEEAEVLKNYKLGSTIKLLSTGFCMKAGKEVDEKLGRFYKIQAEMSTSFFCQLAEAVNDMYGDLSEIGTEHDIGNMIKTGNVAGGATVIYLVIMLIYTSFVSSFAGYKYG